MGEDTLRTLRVVDVRDVTRLADAATAREASELLDDFFEVVVPETTRRPLEREDGLVPRGGLPLEGKAAPVPVHAPGGGR